MALRNNFDGLTPTEKNVLFALFIVRLAGGAGGYLTTSEISRLVGVLDEGRVRNVLHQLENRLYVESKKTGKRSLKWRLSTPVQYVMASVLSDVLGTDDFVVL
jgi:hypothetical protein